MGNNRRYRPEKRPEEERPVIMAPSWATFFVEYRDEDDRLIAVAGACMNIHAAVVMWQWFAEHLPQYNVLLCKGALVMRYSKPHWRR